MIPTACPSVLLRRLGSRLFRSPCARFEPVLSQFVDGSLADDCQADDSRADGARESLLRHLDDCPPCRSEVAELRRTRSLLGSGLGLSLICAPSRLQRRLVSIADGAEAEPLWSRPFRRVEPQLLPSPRRRRHRRAAVAATTFGTLVAAGAGVGFVAGPAAVAAVGDPTVSSRAGFAAARSGVPLAANATTAVMMVGDRFGPALPAEQSDAAVRFYRSAASTTGRRLSPSQSAAMLDESERAAGRVSYSATEQVLSHVGKTMISAEVAVASSAGHDSEISISDANGSEIDRGSLPTPKAAPDRLSTTLAGRYELSGVGDVSLLGRRAAVVEARPVGGSQVNTSPCVRWWIDQQNGMLLGRQSYDQDGVIVQSAMLTSLSTGDHQPVDYSASRLTVSSASPSSISVDPTRLSGLGRAVPQTLAGLPLVSVQTDGTADPDLIQLGYSDGVWRVSVFQSRGVMSGRPAHSVLDPHLAAYRTDGTPQMASWQSADAVITVVTDGPESLLAQAVHSLPHDQHRTPTRMERIQAGWSRIVTSMFG